jgi:hypothetical protein
MDFRFGGKMKELMTERGLMNDADMATFAGSVKNPVNPET